MTSQEKKTPRLDSDSTSSGYPVTIQAVRSKGATERPFVILPVSIARALGIQKGEVVSWHIVDRSQLLLVRQPQESPVQPPRKK